MELLEMVLIEVVEETAGADRMPGDFEIVNVPVPVLANLVGGRPPDLRDPRDLPDPVNVQGCPA
jgi:hypothetical protein